MFFTFTNAISKITGFMIRFFNETYGISIEYGLQRSPNLVRIRKLNVSVSVSFIRNLTEIQGKKGLRMGFEKPFVRKT